MKKLLILSLLTFIPINCFAKEMDNPLQEFPKGFTVIAHGWATFKDGKLVGFVRDIGEHNEKTFSN